MSLVMEEKRPRTRVRERAEEQSATMDLSLIHI